VSDDAPDDDDRRPSGFEDNAELTRADIGLFQQALRNDWPLSPQSRNWILRELAEHAETAKSKRTRLIALKALASIAALNIRQGALDLARAKFAADSDEGSGPTAADVVKEMAEAAERYDRENPPGETRGDRGGTEEVPGGPEPLQ
jgi:hypothetical protein